MVIGQPIVIILKSFLSLYAFVVSVVCGFT